MSVIDDFVTEIKTRLETIRGVTVIDPTRQGQATVNNKTIILETLDVVELEEYDRIGNPPAVGQQLPVNVTFVTIPSELNSPESFQAAASANGSSAQNAITEPVDWHTFGGLSIDAMLSPLRYVKPEDEGFGSAQFTVFIKYRVSETNYEELRA